MCNFIDVYKCHLFSGIDERIVLTTVRECMLKTSFVVTGRMVTEFIKYHSTHPIYAVSYTHLDVYKRQGSYRINVKESGSIVNYFN